MRKTMEDRRAELLSDLATHTAAIVQEYGLEADVAEQVGAALADFVADHWGGQIITIPKDHAFRLSQRDRLILGEFNGANHAELARRYKMAERSIYKLLARAIRRERDLMQGQLFG